MKAFDLIHPPTIAEATRLLAEAAAWTPSARWAAGRTCSGTMKDYILTPDHRRGPEAHPEPEQDHA